MAVLRITCQMSLVALLVGLPVVASRSFYGHRWAGTTGFDDFDGFGFNGNRGRYGNHYGYDDDEYYNDYNEHSPWRRPCPQYKPLELSRWRETQDRQIELQISLPDVHPRNMEASLATDESVIHVKGIRGLPAGGRRCLPDDAQVSANGRYEILKADVPVPAICDARRATVRKTKRGLILSVPRRAQKRSEDTRRPSTSQKFSRPAATTADVRSSGAESTSLKASMPSSHTVLPRQTRARPVLPPSTGITVEDEEIAWPEKDADAASGWMDNRGEFQSY